MINETIHIGISSSPQGLMFLTEAVCGLDEICQFIIKNVPLMNYLSNAQSDNWSVENEPCGLYFPKTVNRYICLSGQILN